MLPLHIVVISAMRTHHMAGQCPTLPRFMPTTPQEQGLCVQGVTGQGRTWCDHTPTVCDTSTGTEAGWSLVCSQQPGPDLPWLILAGDRVPVPKEPRAQPWPHPEFQAPCAGPAHSALRRQVPTLNPALQAVGLGAHRELRLQQCRSMCSFLSATALLTCSHPSSRQQKHICLFSPPAGSGPSPFRHKVFLQQVLQPVE